MYILLSLNEGYLHELSNLLRAKSLTGSYHPEVDPVDRLAAAVRMASSADYLNLSVRAKDGSIVAVASETIDRLWTGIDNAPNQKGD